MRFLAGNAQHIGARHSQQDSFGFGDPDDQAFVAHGGFLAIVCDGMGGMEYGDAASRAAVRAFLNAYLRKTPEESIPAALERSVIAANDAVLTLASSLGLIEGMGTTLVAATLHESAMYFISVGDSGLFHVNAQGMRMVNHPHIFANLLDAAVRRGNMTAEDAANHPERESLTSYIGAQRLDEIDGSVDPFPLADGDALLLASDGLFKTLSIEEMLACCAGGAQTWPGQLVERTMARKREYQDNVTVLSVAIESSQASRLSPAGAPRAVRIPAESPAALPGTARVAPAAPPPAPATVPAPAPVWSPPVQAAPAVAERRKSSMLVPLIVLFLVIAAAAAWWYYTQHRSGLHPVQGGGGAAEAPRRDPSPPPGIAPQDLPPQPSAEPQGKAK